MDTFQWLYVRLSSAETPLLCNWFVKHKPECKVQEGFDFNYTVSDRVTLEVPKATPEFTGLYVCRLLPSDGKAATPCNLTVLGRLVYSPYIFIDWLSSYIYICRA